MFILICGCRHAQDERTPEHILNAPTSRAEGLNLMRSVDNQAITSKWSQGVIREMRSKMTGRLLTSGFNEDEIKNWIESPLTNTTI